MILICTQLFKCFHKKILYDKTYVLNLVIFFLKIVAYHFHNKFFYFQLLQCIIKAIECTSDRILNVMCQVTCEIQRLNSHCHVNMAWVMFLLSSKLDLSSKWYMKQYILFTWIWSVCLSVDSKRKDLVYVGSIS